LSWLEVDRRPPLRFVQLDTGKRNTLHLEAVEALHAALGPDPEAPVVVLRGRTDGFCAGLDNRVLASGRLERDRLLTAMGELLLSILTGPTRLVAVCEGHAVAAGAMLLLVADVRIGTPGEYKLGFTEPGLGMPLPELPALLARERLDRRRLHDLCVLGRIVEPAEAARVGFLDELVASAAVEARAVERAHEIAALSEPAYLGSLRSVWGTVLARMDALVEAQRRVSDAATRAASPD
jgi:enoyl-CoA hydratase